MSFLFPAADSDADNRVLSSATTCSADRRLVTDRLVAASSHSPRAPDHELSDVHRSGPDVSHRNGIRTCLGLAAESAPGILVCDAHHTNAWRADLRGRDARSAAQAIHPCLTSREK